MLNMFSKEDILKRLRAGEEAESIANEMADTINSAISEYRQTEEEERKRKLFEEARLHDAHVAVDAICNFLEQYGGFPHVKTTERAKMAEDLPKLIEETNELFNNLSKELKKGAKKPSTKDSDTQALLDWLESL